MRHMAFIVAIGILGTSALADTRPVSRPPTRATAVMTTGVGRDSAMHTARGQLRAARAAELVATRNAVRALASRHPCAAGCVKVERPRAGVTVARVQAVVRRTRVVHKQQTATGVEVRVRVPAAGVKPVPCGAPAHRGR